MIILIMKRLVIFLYHSSGSFPNIYEDVNDKCMNYLVLLIYIHSGNLSEEDHSVMLEPEVFCYDNSHWYGT
jgi:hypothetical protein